MTNVYLTRDAVLAAGAIACGIELSVSDEGLLQSAVMRPRATVFGSDAYPELWDKAAALLHSLARNHALVDGNKRTAWAAAWTFLVLNGIELADDYDVDHAEQFVLALATGDMDVAKITAELRTFAE